MTHERALRLSTPGQRIRVLREALEMTQETLARKLHTTQPAVSQWENDHCIPIRAHQGLVAEALKTTRTFLFGEDANGEVA